MAFPNHKDHRLRPMAAGRMTEKDIDSVTRRLASITSHIVAPTRESGPRGFPSAIGLRNAAASFSDSYQRVHGEVPSHPPVWRVVPDDSGKGFTDIIYEKTVGEGIAKITINRPEKRNSFRPLTVKELMRAFSDARDDTSIGVIIFTGKGTEAFCSGGDQSVRIKTGYADPADVGRLNVLDLQVQIRRLPKPVIAMVAGYAVGGGHILHMVCDLTIAADNAVFGQTGPKVGSFDAGYGCSIMTRLIGPKRAREMWFMARFYNAAEADKMGLVNTVVPLASLEQETVKWCRQILRNSPTAIRVCKSALNAVDDGHAGLQELAGNATLLFYSTEEANEGKTAYLNKTRPNFSKFPRLP
ncbi:hypothetical protein SAY86_022963 [Trapa natans]|uniref:1,4-dihydroxy-2-naphthoyl-CoA synthase n=1 Tax=Trapa natans TaxID=22666 RepID=A0AAN7RB45_TRANT|nr:hypothetical protein SAY86_022963 [Trapa natans]